MILQSVVDIINGSSYPRFTLTISLMCIVFIVYGLLVRLIKIKKWGAHFDTQRKFIVMVRNALLIVFLFLVALIWLGGTSNFVFSVAALGAATVIATKDLFSSASGGVIRFISRVSIGDKVQIGEIQGEVVDMTVLTTSLLETLPNGIFTGKLLKFANSEFLTKMVRMSSNQGSYDVKITRVTIPLNSYTYEAQENLLNITKMLCSDIVDATKMEFKQTESNMFYDMPNVEPRATLELNAKDSITITLRYPVKNGEAVKMEQNILQEFLKSDFFKKIGPL